MTDMRLFKKKNDASAHSEKLHSSNLVMRISREKMSDVANLSWIRDSTQFSPSIWTMSADANDNDDSDEHDMKW